MTDKKHPQTTDSLSFIGNLSVVVHFANLTRIACANLESVRYEGNGFMDSIDDMFNAAYAALDVQ